MITVVIQERGTIPTRGITRLDGRDWLTQAAMNRLAEFVVCREMRHIDNSEIVAKKVSKCTTHRKKCIKMTTKPRKAVQHRR